MKNEDFDLIDFNNVKLDDVEFDSSKIEKAKKRLLENINKLKEDNKSLEINDDVDSISAICKEYNIDKKDLNSGNYNKIILKNLIFESICKKVLDEYGNILFKGFFKKGSDIAFNNILYYNQTSYFYCVFVTDDKIIIYSLNNYFQVINKVDYKLKDIKGFGVNKAEYHKDMDEIDKFKLNIHNSDKYYVFANSKAINCDGIIRLDEVLVEKLKEEKSQHYDKKYFVKKDRKALKIAGNISMIISIIIILGLVILLLKN